MTNTASSPTAKTPKRKPKPLLPPEEVVKAPPPKLTPREKIGQFFAGSAAKIPIRNPLATPPVTVDEVNENLEIGRFDRVLKTTTRQAVVIAFLGCALAVGAPFFAPLYVYSAVTPEGVEALLNLQNPEKKDIGTLVPLDMPNLTNPAIVSWAATSATEILSFGFGDIDAKTILQKKRFTTPGWKAFVKSFLTSKVGETFKRNQMVMTTVPSDTPVILSQGVNDDNVFQWKVEVPIITTYAANNNVIKPELGTIQMTIVRVSYDQSPSGVAIDLWRQIKH